MSAIRSQSRVFRDLARGRRVEVGFLDTDKIYRMKQDKVEKFSISGLKTCGILLKNHEQVKGGSRRCRRTPRNI